MTVLQQWLTSQANPEIPVNENFTALEHVAVYAKDATTTTGLTWGYLGGRWGGFAITAGTLTLTASNTNYIVAARATGVLSVSTASTNWDNTDDYARVYLLTVGTSTVTTVEDHRTGEGGIIGAPIPAGGGSGTLASLSDVDVTGVSDGDALVYDSGTSKWIPGAGGGGGGIVIDTAQAATSGTAKNYTIPAGTKRITALLSGVSTSGTSLVQFQLGTGGAPTTSGYATSISRQADGSAIDCSAGVTSGFALNTGNSGNLLHGSIVFLNITGNTWIATGNFASTSGQVCTLLTIGTISLSGVVDYLRITTINGTDTFDAGTVNIAYE